MAHFEWDLCQSMLSEVDPEGFLGIGYDLYGGNAAGADLLELHSTYGFRSRPLDPDVDPSTGKPKPGSACTVWVVYEGSRGHAMLAGDPRVTQIVPTLEKGESLHYGPKGNFVRCHLDGSITAQTTSDGTVTGQTIQMRLGPDEWMVAAPWGQIHCDVNGFRVQDHSGAKLQLGGIGGMPSPLDKLNNWAKLAAAMIKLEGTAVVLGPPGPKDAVTKATLLQGVLVTIMGAIQAVQNAMATITTTTPATGAAAAAISAPVVAAAASAVAASADVFGSKNTTTT